jgi:hypothetical protein
VHSLTDLGTKKIPVFVALSLTTVADKVQDALIAHTRLRLTVRGRWLVKGYKYGINRYRATKHNLAAEVWTQAPWLLEQEVGEPISPEKAKRFAVPFSGIRSSRLSTHIVPKRLRPRRLKRTFLIKTKAGEEILFQRKGRESKSFMFPVYHLQRQTRIPQRLVLVETAMHAIDRHAPGAMDYALSQAIREAALSK